MKIVLAGYGKMGKAIEKIAESRGHQIVARLNEKPDADALASADVVIEFSRPGAAFENIKFCLEQKVPVVCGTTGWLEKKPQIEQIAAENATAFLYGSNFSVGVNLFFALNEKLAQLMGGIPEYRAQLEEVHHVHKMDAPSGTAITLAEGIIAHNPAFRAWKQDETRGAELGIFSIREDEVPGTHTVAYTSEVDEIEIKHTAFSRDGFALGAVLAAEWVIGKAGSFSIRDVLGI